MSGHSKWASIKHKKAAIDAKRGKIFSRLSKEVTVAAKAGGGDQDMNPRLRTAVLAAKAANMPADNIDRAIKKGTGELPGVVYEEVMYEAYGHGGVAILIQVLTDNRNRATGELRATLERRGGSLAGSGSVAWQFSKKGFLIIGKEGADEDTVLMAAMDAGADDMKTTDAGYEITTSLASFEAVKEALEKAGVHPKSAEITMLPASTVQVTDEKAAKSLLQLIEAIEELDDVQNVYANFDMDQALMEKVMAE
ncbi:YebC/PmpR family DNA-binding transcriptional regulator [bacterium]|nr:YebC/PmpR family DNA-binding transcriptional regulator [bacterium]